MFHLIFIINTVFFIDFSDFLPIDCYENVLLCMILPSFKTKDALRPQGKISPEWLVGFTEAEGTFAIDITDAKDMKLGKKVQLSFMITQHLLDANLLHEINTQFFNSKGYVENSRDADSKVKRIRIRDFKTILNVVIPFYDVNNFYSRKKLDYTDWRTVAFMMEKKLH